MTRSPAFDAVVVGAGPNGLTAAVRLATAGWSVLVVEGAATVGGGARSAELTLPGFVHDVCSAIHPLAVSSPFLSSLPLERHGLEFVDPPVPVAHPLDDGTAVLLDRSVDETAANLGPDGPSYAKLIGPFVEQWGDLARDVLGPMGLPRNPVQLARFGFQAVRSAAGLARSRFTGSRARALFAGLAAHSILPLESPLTAGFALVMGVSAHAVGWPVARGGSQAIADALAGHLRSLGGEIETGHMVGSIDELPPARAYLLDVVPRDLGRISGARLPKAYRDRLFRYRHGPGVFKVDYALDGPIPWRASEALQSGTVHLGGTLEEIAEGEREVAEGRHPERPFVLLAQPSLFDRRAPAGKHTAWAYCHVPNGSTVEMTGRIDAQIERFAPGFGDLVLGRSVRTPADLERDNPNNVGGDIAAGSHGGLQLFARPALRFVPYTTPAPDVFLCSAATPPGAGVHGMCGFHAAQAVLRRVGQG